MTRVRRPEQKKLLNGDNANDNNLFRKASDAMDRALMESEGSWKELPSREEPTDHEAEGAMLYVMSRGRH
jgi:hypothetical protein